MLMEQFGSLPEQQLLLLFCFMFFIFLCFGSFLNVVIYRLPIMLERQWQKEAHYILGQPLEDDEEEAFNLAFPASACPSCKAAIKPWQNIPVISYLLLGGKCSGCGLKISLRYPFVELIAAVLSFLAVYEYGLTLQGGAMVVLTLCLICLIGIDYDHQLLPDSITLPLLWLGLLLNVFDGFVSIESSVIGAVVGYLSLWTVYWLFKLITGKEGMGFGDFKLLAVFGAWFGWQVLPNIVLLSSVVGAVLGVAMIVLSKRDSQKPMAFGPFLAIAGWLTVLYPGTFIVMDYIS